MRLALGLVIKALTDYSDYSYHPESQSVGKKTAHDKAAPRCNIRFILISSTISFLSKIETSANLERFGTWEILTVCLLSFPFLSLS